MNLIKSPRLFQLLALIAFLTSFSSCKKSNDAPPPTVEYNIQGLWVGTVANATASEFYSLSIKPDGKITFESIIGSQEQFGAGTWTLVGSNFSAHVTSLYGLPSNVGVQQTLTAKFDTKTGLMSEGKYVNTSPANDSGTFILTKAN